MIPALAQIMLMESRANPNAVSPVGAQGLMQVMPATARQPGFGIAPLQNPFDPAENVRFGTDYWNKMLDRYDGDERRALVAYNYGPGNADKWSGDLSELPEETRNYIQSFEARTSQNGKPWTEEQIAKAQGYLGEDMQIEQLARAIGLTPGDQLPTQEIAPTQVMPQGAQQVAARAPVTPPQSPQASSGGWGREEIGLALQALGEGLSSISQRRPADMRAVNRQIQARQARQQEAQVRNQTVEYLAKNGMEDLAELAKGGALSPKEALSMGLGTPKDERTALIKNYEFARSQGYDGSFQQFMQDSRNGTTVNVGSEVGTIPQGYELVTTESGGRALRPIPGGPVAQAAAEAAERGTRQDGAATEKFNRINADVSRAISLAQDGNATGAFSLLADIPLPTDARMLRNTVKSLQANLSFEALQSMREASKTGGALGSITERELDLLQSTVATLDPGAGEEELVRQLQKVRSHITTLRDISNGTFDPSKPTGRVRKYNPETGRIE